MTIELIHTSPVEIKEINRFGRFGSWMFFSSNEYSMSGAEYLKYKIEIAEDEIIDARQFFYRDDCEKLESLVGEVMEMCEVDEDEAQDILSDRGFSTDDAELSWDLQHMTAQAAKKLGYSAVEMRDEQGTCWMIDMSVHFKNMKLV